jgi:bifunctional non-homologous end joining protein LigD
MPRHDSSGHLHVYFEGPDAANPIVNMRHSYCRDYGDVVFETPRSAEIVSRRLQCAGIRKTIREPLIVHSRQPTMASMPANIRLQIVSPCKKPPDGDGWLHEIKHDGHRLLAHLPNRGQPMLLSRNGYERTKIFREPFRPLIDAGLPSMVLDGEIAVPDDRGVTHLDWLSEAISDRRPERLAYFAFDLLHLDGHDLRRCPIEDRKMLLRDVLGSARFERIVYVDHVRGVGPELFEAVQQIGAEGIVSKRRGSIYRGGESRDWLKTKCSETGMFAITGFHELGEGRLDAIYLAEERNGELRLAGQVRFGLPARGYGTSSTGCATDRRERGSSRSGSVWSRRSSSSADTRPAGYATA